MKGKVERVDGCDIFREFEKDTFVLGSSGHPQLHQNYWEYLQMCSAIVNNKFSDVLRFQMSVEISHDDLMEQDTTGNPKGYPGFVFNVQEGGGTFWKSEETLRTPLNYDFVYLRYVAP